MICISQGEFCNNLIFNPQLETGNSATSFEPYISDLEGIEVKRTGKNLFSYKRFIEFGNSFDPSWGRIGTYLGKECFIYKNKHSTPTSNQFTFMKGEFLENTQYTISLGATYSFNDIASYSMPVLAFVYTDGTVSSIQTRLYNTEYVNFYSTSKANKTISHILVQNFSSGCTVYIKTNIQLEKGTSATEYEAFAEPQTAKALSDGVVEELTSLSPNMIILSHSKGVKIKAEYNADLKLYIDKRIKELTN